MILVSYDQAHVGLPAQRGICFSLSLFLPIAHVFSLINTFKKLKKTEFSVFLGLHKYEKIWARLFLDIPPSFNSLYVKMYKPHYEKLKIDVITLMSTVKQKGLLDINI